MIRWPVATLQQNAAPGRTPGNALSRAAALGNATPVTFTQAPLVFWVAAAAAGHWLALAVLSVAPAVEILPLQGKLAIYSHQQDESRRRHWALGQIYNLEVAQGNLNTREGDAPPWRAVFFRSGVPRHRGA